MTVRRCLLALAMTVGLLAVTAPVSAATISAVGKPGKATWVWSGPQQHPYATAHPTFTYVASGAKPAETLLTVPSLLLPTSTSSLVSVTVDIPSSTSPQDGYYSTPVDSSGAQGAAPAMQVCPVTHTWDVEPAGRPQEAALTWNCQLLVWQGELKTVAGAPHWVFDLTAFANAWIVGQLPNDGVALMPIATSTGAWAVPLSTKDAVVTVTTTEASTSPSVPLGGGVSTTVNPPPALTVPVPQAAPPVSLGPVPPDPALAAAPPAAPPVIASSPAPVAIQQVADVKRTVPPGAWALLALVAALLLVAARFVRPPSRRRPGLTQVELV
jgi:hypothetical protein